MARTVAVILSGCGFMDGAEIHESVCTLLALSQAGATVKCYAPDAELDVVDHRTGEATGEKRNALAESARIARGEIEDVASARAEDLDAVILPGGFGAAKVLSNFAEAGDGCEVHADVARLLRDVHAAGKPIGKRPWDQNRKFGPRHAYQAYQQSTRKEAHFHSDYRTVRGYD